MVSFRVNPVSKEHEMLSRCRRLAGLSFAAGVICFTAISLAEPPADGGPPGGDSAGPGMGRRMMRRGPNWMMPGAVEQLLDSLKLDDAQRKTIDAKVSEIQEQNREKMRAARMSPEQMQKMREMQEQMRAARDSQDKAKMDELRGEMMKVMAAQREASTQAEQQLHDAIKAELKPEQVEQFEKAWSEGPAGGMRGMMMGRGQSMRDMRRAVMTLDLQPDQKTKIDEIFAEARKSDRAAAGGPGGPGGPGGDDPASMKALREKIDAVLTDTQKAEFEKKLSEMGGRRRGPGRRPGPPGGPDGEDAPPPPPEPGNP